MPADKGGEGQRATILLNRNVDGRMILVCVRTIQEKESEWNNNNCNLINYFIKKREDRERRRNGKRNSAWNSVVRIHCVYGNGQAVNRKRIC